MAGTAWTPGPWSVKRLGPITPWTGALSIMAADGQSAVAHTTRGWEGDGTDGDTSGQANAALIAAAPELYEALEHMTAFIQKWVNPSADLPYNYHTALRALARARGEAQ